jgi:hypothetical protein
VDGRGAAVDGAADVCPRNGQTRAVALVVVNRMPGSTRPDFHILVLGEQ